MSCLPKGYEVCAPGKDRGPCEDAECSRLPCRSARVLATSSCAACGSPIGFNRPMLFCVAFTGGIDVRHEACP